jgi:hypothetical protein
MELRYLQFVCVLVLGGKSRYVFLQALRALCAILMTHSTALERLQNELGANLQQSVENTADDDLPYFHFIEAGSLEVLCSNSFFVILKDLI